MRHMSATELNAYLAQSEPTPLLLDVREAWEYQICRLAGARLVPMRHIPVHERVGPGARDGQDR